MSSDSGGLKSSMSDGPQDEQIPPLPAGVDALVLPGFPNRSDLDRDEGSFYPGETVDIVKLLKEQGLTVDFAEAREDRKTLELKAAEFWAPILVFAYEAAAHGAGALLAHAIIQRLGHERLKRAIVHVKCGSQQSDGTTEWFVADGPGEEVVKALKEWKSDSS
jgi:hypothetical protein